MTNQNVCKSVFHLTILLFMAVWLLLSLALDGLHCLRQCVIWDYMKSSWTHDLCLRSSWQSWLGGSLLNSMLYINTPSGSRGSSFGHPCPGHVLCWLQQRANCSRSVMYMHNFSNAPKLLVPLHPVPTVASGYSSQVAPDKAVKGNNNTNSRCCLSCLSHCNSGVQQKVVLMLHSAFGWWIDF